jgi:hypothetical protein
MKVRVDVPAKTLEQMCEHLENPDGPIGESYAITVHPQLWAAVPAALRDRFTRLCERRHIDVSFESMIGQFVVERDRVEIPRNSAPKLGILSRLAEAGGERALTAPGSSPEDDAHFTTAMRELREDGLIEYDDARVQRNKMTSGNHYYVVADVRLTSLGREAYDDYRH